MPHDFQISATLCELYENYRTAQRTQYKVCAKHLHLCSISRSISSLVFHLKPGLAFRAKKVRRAWKSDQLFFQPSNWLEDSVRESETTAIWTVMAVCSVSSSYIILKHMLLFIIIICTLSVKSYTCCMREKSASFIDYLTPLLNIARLNT